MDLSERHQNSWALLCMQVSAHLISPGCISSFSNQQFLKLQAFLKCYIQIIRKNNEKKAIKRPKALHDASEVLTQAHFTWKDAWKAFANSSPQLQACHAWCFTCNSNAWLICLQAGWKNAIRMPWGRLPASLQFLTICYRKVAQSY